MPDPRGIALSISNRRPVIQDDPEYDKLLLALEAEQPEALQDDELAHLQTLRPPTFRAQNDPAADRARLGVPEYVQPMSTFLGASMSDADVSSGPVQDTRSEAMRQQAVRDRMAQWAQMSGLQRRIAEIDPSAGNPRMSAGPAPARSTARISRDLAGAGSLGDVLMATATMPTAGVIRASKVAGVMEDPRGTLADQDALDALQRTPRRMLGGTTASIGPPTEPMWKRLARETLEHMDRVGGGEEEPDTTGSVMTDMALDPTNYIGLVKAPVAMAAAMIGKPKKLLAAVRTAKRLKEAVEPFIGALDKASHKALIQEVKAVFPHLDSYSTLSPHLTAASIAKKLDTLSPDAQAAVRAIAEVMPAGERIAPKQLQALVARKKYTPDRIVVRHNTTLAQHQARGKEYMGAPWHVHTPRLQASSDQQYLDQVLDGLEGADWYDDSGRAVMSRTGDNPVRARQTSDAVAITSPQTDVNVNTAFAIQANNQRAMGRPVRTGRYPSVMGPKIEAAYAAEGAETLGPKRGPFADNIAIGGDFFDADRPIRGVHDIWDGEARGFANPDGTPLRRGFTAPEHRWMDAQDARLVAFANDTKIGGRTDWTVGRLQAAAWTGSKKRAGDILPGEPVANIATAFRRPNVQAQGSREVASPIHFRELNEPPNRPELDRYSRLVREKSGVYDPEGRDRLALEMGGLVGETSEGPGMFKNEPALGFQTDVSATTQPTVGPSLAGIDLESLKLPQKQSDKLAKLIAEGKTLDQALSGKFGREMEISAQEMLTVTESAYGLLFGQAAGAGSMMGTMPTEAALRAWRVAATSKYDVPILGAEVLLGATPTNAQMLDAMRVFTQAGATPNSIAPVFVPGRGIRFGNLAESTLSDNQFKKAVNDVAKVLGGSKTKGRFSSIYVSNDWDTQQYGEEFLGNLLPHAEKLDPLLKEISSTMLTDVDPYMKRTTSAGPLTASRRLTRIREVLKSGEGLQALEALAKKNGLPLLGLLALLGVAPPRYKDETGVDTSGGRDNAAGAASPGYAGSMRSLLAR